MVQATGILRLKKESPDYEPFLHSPRKLERSFHFPSYCRDFGEALNIFPHKKSGAACDIALTSCFVGSA